MWSVPRTREASQRGHWKHFVSAARCSPVVCGPVASSGGRCRCCWGHGPPRQPSRWEPRQGRQEKRPFPSRQMQTRGQPLVRREAPGRLINFPPVAVTERWEGSSGRAGRRQEPGRGGALGGAEPGAGVLSPPSAPAQSLIYFCRNSFQGRDVPRERLGAAPDLQIAYALNRPFVPRGRQEGGDWQQMPMEGRN